MRLILICTFLCLCLFGTIVMADNNPLKSSGVSCMDLKQKQSCEAQLVESMKSNGFLKAILAAESARLPPSWKCDVIGYWKVEHPKVGGVTASATTSCMGPEQHVNLDFQWNLETEASGTWVVRITSFKERPGM